MRGQAILVTGSAGLIGRRLCRCLQILGADVLEIDLRHAQLPRRVDIRDRARMQKLVSEADGIIHLAAISRVVEGQKHPETCWSINAEATGALLDLCFRSPTRPWLLYSSSREVYGEQDYCPVREDAPLRPMNVYARSKVAAENLVAEARARGLVVGVARFSNVYGDVLDHADRVLPSFARACAFGGEIRVEGPNHCFDFTHVDDVAEATCSMAMLLASGERRLPTIHFPTGVPTTLGRLCRACRCQR